MQFVLMLVRDEEQRDLPAIAEIIREAFRNAAHSSGKEAQIVDILRRSDALTVSLVATEEEAVIGHIAVSPVSVASEEGWYGLGPVAVRPEWQGNGIGSRLITEALGRVKERGAAACVVLGDPDFYGKFGFVHDPNVTYADVPPPYFQFLSFGSGSPRGRVAYNAAFDV